MNAGPLGDRGAGVRSVMAAMFLVVLLVTLPASGPTTALGQPPWATANANDARSAAELLQLYGVRGGDLASFADPAVGQADRQRILLQTLFHLPRFTPAEWQRWRRSAPALAEVLAAPAAHRGAALQLVGVCRRAVRHDVPPALAETLEFTRYYEIEIEVTDPALSVRAYARQIPRAWTAAELNEPVTLDGILLDHGATSTAPELIVAAPRVAWYPSQPIPSQGIGPAQLRLAEQGVDLSRFDQARERNGSEFDNNERELFYQLLAAVRQLDTARMAGAAPWSLVELLKDPPRHQGQLLRFHAQARRITPVIVEDADIRERYGITAYYHVDALVMLEDQQIRLESPVTGKSALYTDKFPITFCAIDLPAALRKRVQAPGALAGERPLLNERVQLSGYFFKLWPYGSDFLHEVDARQQHPSPLFLGTSVRLDPVASPPRDSPLGMGLAAVVTFSLLGGLGLLGYRGRQQRAQRRAKLRSAPPPEL